MTTKIYYDYDDMQNQIQLILRGLVLSDWRPDIIVGIGRGGAIPAVIMSHWLKAQFVGLDVSLRDDALGIGPESNAWLAEMALGYGDVAQHKILIVDDINDSGATINWIKRDWQSGCVPDSPDWDDHVWHKGTRFACLVDNANSDAIIDYSGVDIAKTDEYDPWIVFPWEIDE